LNDADDVGPFGVGAVLDVPEAHYLYGIGPLALRVTEADIDPYQHPAMEWVNVLGVPIYPNGAVGPERYVTIRVIAIKSALRRRHWVPPQRSSELPVQRRAG
jgi:hypothetical protein